MGRAASPDSGGVEHAGGGEGHPRLPRAVRLRQVLSRYCFINAPPTSALKVLFYQCSSDKCSQGIVLSERLQQMLSRYCFISAPSTIAFIVFY